MVVTSYLTKLKAARAGLQAFLSERARSKAGREYHLWFYDTEVWKGLRWFGVPIPAIQILADVSCSCV